MIPQGKKKIIKRRPKGSGPSKMYFGPDTQDAIVAHQKLEKAVKKLDNLIFAVEKNEFEETIEEWLAEERKLDSEIKEKDVIKKYLPEKYKSLIRTKNQEQKIKGVKKARLDKHREKHALYTKEIQPAFDKLVENLIFLYGFMGLHDSYEDLKSDCVTNLYSSIGKYNVEKGYKAFSYFNIVAKNFLIIKTKKRSSKIKMNISIDDEDAMGAFELDALRDYNTLPSIDDLFINREFNSRIKYLLSEIKIRLKKESEIKCIESIASIFNNIDNIDMLNKRAVFVLIREQSGLNPKQLTTTMSIIKKYYRELKKNYEFGIF